MSGSESNAVQVDTHASIRQILKALSTICEVTRDKNMAREFYRKSLTTNLRIDETMQSESPNSEITGDAARGPR